VGEFFRVLTRMNFALALTSARLSCEGGCWQLLEAVAQPPLDSTFALSKLESSLLDGDVSKQTHDSITAQIDAAR